TKVNANGSAWAHTTIAPEYYPVWSRIRQRISKYETNQPMSDCIAYARNHGAASPGANFRRKPNASTGEINKAESKASYRVEDKSRDSIFASSVHSDSSTV